MAIRLDYTNMLSDAVGEDGLDAGEFSRAVERAEREAPGFLGSLPAFARLVEGSELVRRAKKSVASRSVRRRMFRPSPNTNSNMTPIERRLSTRASHLTILAQVCIVPLALAFSEGKPR